MPTHESKMRHQPLDWLFTHKLLWQKKVYRIAKSNWILCLCKQFLTTKTTTQILCYVNRTITCIMASKLMNYKMKFVVQFISRLCNGQSETEVFPITGSRLQYIHFLFLYSTNLKGELCKKTTVFHSKHTISVPFYRTLNNHELLANTYFLRMECNTSYHYKSNIYNDSL